MTTKDEEYTTATDEHGTEYVAETSAVLTSTDADGTEYVAEITTTAHEDDPTVVDSQMTITQTDSDGTETVTEYVTKEDGTYMVNEDSDLENAVDAFLGVELDEDLTKVSDEGTYHPEDHGAQSFTQNHSDSGETDFGNQNQSYEAGVYEMTEPYNSTYAETDTHSNILEASDGTTASDYLVTDTSFDVEPIETSTTAEDVAYNAEYNADYADYYQDQADIAHDTAIDYAEHGDADAAAVYQESYENHQAAADDWSSLNSTDE